MSRLVDQKYIGLIASRLSLFKKKGRAWNFRCPFCGDSKRKKLLCRGFLFEYKGATLYKCHNCGLATGFSSFLDRLDSQLFKQYQVETFSEKNPRQVVVRVTTAPTNAVQPPIVPLSNAANLPRLDELPPFHPAVVYARSRKIPTLAFSRIWYAERMRDLEALAPDRYKDVIPTDARLVLPYYYGGQLVGVTGRAINPLVQKRYIQLRFVDNVPLVFGLDKFDAASRGYIVEGPLDSLFLPNAIACGGMDFEKVLESGIVQQTLTTVVLDNQPRNKDVVRRMRGMVEKKWATCVWPINWAYKDINEVVIAGIDPHILKQLIDDNTFFRLQLELAVNTWRKC